MSGPEQAPGPGEITALLRRMRSGDAEARDRLFPLVYDELRRAAQRALRGERPDHSLRATELVHEVYLKLGGTADAPWHDRAHFVGVAARAMRQILVDHARRRGAVKRGGGWARTTLEDVGASDAMPPEEILALDEALSRLDTFDPRLRAVVEYRFFGGLGDREIAELLGVSERTINRDWTKARAWLYRELYPESE
jgi:RNA polymerase sigma factor (TIGR02999 family)